MRGGGLSIQRRYRTVNWSGMEWREEEEEEGTLLMEEEFATVGNAPGSNLI